VRFLRLAKLFILNHIKGEIFLTVLSITGIALGIGLFVGVKAATDRAVVSFQETMQGVNPYANYEVVDAAGVDFDENIYREIRQKEENSFPFLQTNGYLPDKKVSIDITGIYTVKMARFVGFEKRRGYDVSRFFGERNGVFVTKEFSERYHLRRGDTMNAFVYDGVYPLRIAGILNATALPPNTVLMDLGNFQEYFGKSGVLSGIDLSTSEKTAEIIRDILPSRLSIESKSGVIRQQQSLITSFRYNLQFITFLAVLVGIFLLYNTIFISVVKRRTEVGILRSLGADKRTVVLLFTIKGLILGFIGSVLGIVLGQAFSYFSIIAVERTISTIYRSISISHYLITWTDALKALALGCFVSFLASLMPALESAKVRPNESSKAGSFEKKHRRNQTLLSLIGLVSILFGGVLSFLDYVYVPNNFPYLAYAGILFFIFGFTFISPTFLALLLSVLRRPARCLFRTTGGITVSDIDGSRYRFSVALMSVAISSALIIALLSSIFSLKSSFREWLDDYLIADVYVKPASCRSNYCFTPLSDNLSEEIRRFPEVRDVGKFRALQLDFMGKRVTAGFGDTAVWRKYRKKDYPDSRTLSVSDYLKVKYGLKPGDEVVLETPRGRKTFIVYSTSISFSTTSGFIYLDRKWLKELWGLDDATQLTIYLQKGSDAGRFIEKLRRELPAAQGLTLTNNRELRERSLEIFDKSFALTYAIELIAIVISLIGVINTLLILVFEKKREISIIRYLGGGWDQIRNIMVLSAGIVGVAGIMLGGIMGPAISIVIIHVINKISFGWEVDLRLPLGYLASLTVVLFLTTLAAGIIPAKAAQRIDPKKFISFE
jgi:putative ABC transport system permease protein